MTNETLKRLELHAGWNPDVLKLLASYRAERRFSGRLMLACGIKNPCFVVEGGKKCNRRNCPVRKEVGK